MEIKKDVHKKMNLKKLACAILADCNILTDFRAHAGSDVTAYALRHGRDIRYEDRTLPVIRTYIAVVSFSECYHTRHPVFIVWRDVPTLIQLVRNTVRIVSTYPEI